VLAESVAAAAFSLVSMLAIGRVIGPDAMGTGTIAIAAFLLLDVFAAALFPDALVQRRAVAARHADSAATASVAVGAAAGLALAAAGPFLAGGSTSSPEVPWLALALAPLLPLSAFSGTASGLLLREQRFRLLALRLLIGQPLALAAGLLVALAGHGPWAMVANQAVNTLVTFLVMLRGGRLGLRPRLDLGALRDLWPVAGPQVAGVAVMAGKYRLFLLALGLAVSPAVLAVSHFAFRLLDAALAVVWQAVGRLSMPRLCALQHDRDAMAEAYGELAQLQALLGLPIAAGIALAAPDLVRALLGPAWAGAGEAARVAAAAMLGFLHGPVRRGGQGPAERPDRRGLPAPAAAGPRAAAAANAGGGRAHLGGPGLGPAARARLGRAPGAAAPGSVAGAPDRARGSGDRGHGGGRAGRPGRRVGAMAAVGAAARLRGDRGDGLRGRGVARPGRPPATRTGGIGRGGSCRGGGMRRGRRVAPRPPGAPRTCQDKDPFEHLRDGASPPPRIRSRSGDERATERRPRPCES
jgi:hypothetical protein